QFRLGATPMKGWNITAELNYRLRNEFRHWDTQKIYNHDVKGEPVLYGDGTTEVYEYANSSNYMNPNVFTDYSFNIKDSNHFKIMLGFQSEQEKVMSFSARRNGVIVPYMDVIDATSGNDGGNKAVPPSVSGNRNLWATTGFFGRINYDYKERYLAEVNMRYDGTSRYRQDKRWNWFPSFSLGWNIAKEKFWENNLNVMSTFKVRGSYGELGNQNTNAWYPTYSSMGIGSANSYWLINGQKQNTAGAPALLNSMMTWESVNTVNVGLDVAFLRNRLTGSFDWFNRKTLDMIGPAPELPVTLGTAVPKENNTDLSTFGWELSLKWNDRTRSGFGYSVGFLLSDSQTKITSYPNDNYNLNIGNGGGGAGRYYKDQKMGEIWGYKTIGIAKSQAEMDAHIASLPKGGQNALGSQWAAGDIMYEDINHDGKIDYGKKTAGPNGDTGDLQIIGNNQSRYMFGIDLSADYKGFDIRAFFQGCMKRDYMPNNPTFWGVSGGTWWSLALPQHMDYFRENPTHRLGQNLDSYYPRPLMGNGKNYTSQTGYLQSAAFIRLKNIQLGYTFNNAMMNKIGVSYLRVFVSGENLWTGTKLASMFDPETVDGGYNGVAYPLQKVISFGFSVNF
ncbi:MAG: SusC/RagA family TonB-linked outer membrane protein, partial [Rikenellaceae bacterium]